MAVSPNSLARRWSEHQIRRLVPGGSGRGHPDGHPDDPPEPPEPNRTDDVPHVTRLDPTGADQSDGEHSPTDLAVGGSNPSRRARFRRSAAQTARVVPRSGSAGTITAGPVQPPWLTSGYHPRTPGAPVPGVADRF